MPAASVGPRPNATAGSPAFTSRAAGARSQRPRHGLRCHVTLPSRAGSPAGPRRAGKIVAEGFGAGEAARDVVADVRHGRGTRLRSQQGIERGHAPGLGRRHGQATADVAQRGLADPADACLHGVERRQQQVAHVTGGMPAAGDVAIDAAVARAAGPARDGRSEHGVDRRAFDGRGQRADDVQVHRVRV